MPTCHDLYPCIITNAVVVCVRIEIEKRQAAQRAVFQQQQRSRWEQQRNGWLSCLAADGGVCEGRAGFVYSGWVGALLMCVRDCLEGGWAPPR